MIALNPERFHAANPRPAATPTIPRLADEQVDELCDELIADRPSSERLHVFAYGSLLWNPAFEADQKEPAVALGWHRAFRMTQTSWRGSPENPGLMMILDRGGCCRGIAMSVTPEKRRVAVRALIRREMSSRATANQPRWIPIDIGGRREAALAFCIDRRSRVYAGRQTEEAVADTLARAIGPAGSCAEYLAKTVTALTDLNIPDRNLDRLQTLVAQRILSNLLLATAHDAHTYPATSPDEA